MLIISCHWKLITFRTEVKVKCKKRGNFFIMFQHKCIVANLKSSFVVLNCTSVIFPIGKNSKSGERPGFSVLLILDGSLFLVFFFFLSMLISWENCLLSIILAVLSTDQDPSGYFQAGHLEECPCFQLPLDVNQFPWVMVYISFVTSCKKLDEE